MARIERMIKVSVEDEIDHTTDLRWQVVGANKTKIDDCAPRRAVKQQRSPTIAPSLRSTTGAHPVVVVVIIGVVITGDIR